MSKVEWYLNRLVKFIRLISPICFHNYERLGEYGFTRKCKKCNKEMMGSQTVVRHGDWIFKRGD